MTGRHTIIRNLNYILIALCLATPSIAETNFEENANPVEVSSSQGADNNSYDNHDNSQAQQVAPAAPDFSDTADVTAFRDMDRLSQGDYQSCYEMYERCLNGQGQNPVCTGLQNQCSKHVEGIPQGNVTASAY